MNIESQLPFVEWLADCYKSLGVRTMVVITINTSETSQFVETFGGIAGEFHVSLMANHSHWVSGMISSNTKDSHFRDELLTTTGFNCLSE